jgi:hypothetical protein
MNLVAILIFLIAKDALILGMYRLLQAAAYNPALTTTPADFAGAVAWLVAAVILGVIAYRLVRTANRNALLALKARTSAAKIASSANSDVHSPVGGLYHPS